MKSAATKDRNLHTFLLVAQLEAKAIGARLAQARREAGMTQVQVSEVSTVSERSLQDYEAGVTIPYRHFRELAGVYDRPVEWFLHGDRPPDEQVLLGEVAASVGALQEGVQEVLERLSRIEAAVSPREAADTNTTPG